MCLLVIAAFRIGICGCIRTYVRFLKKIVVSRRTAPDHQGRRQPLGREDALAKKVRTLERKLVKEQREKMRVQATRARDAIERAEMEEFFMRCVEVRTIQYRNFRCAFRWLTLKKCEDANEVVTSSGISANLKCCPCLYAIHISCSANVSICSIMQAFKKT